LIAELEMTQTNTEKARAIAQSALEVATNPNINNYFFSVLLQRLIAETYIIKGDFETARMYIEQALIIAEKMNLHLIQAKLYLTFGKIYHEAAVVSEKNRAANVNNAHALYMRSLNIVQKNENDRMIEKIEKELTDLSTLCQLSGIRL
jgi:ATP/maltotriose-dependent transcriptional regulator MalT